MRYRIPIQEKISVWQSIDIVIETDDDIDTVYDHIRSGTLIHEYSYDEVTNEVMWETCENIEYDYGHTSKGCINELDDE